MSPRLLRSRSVAYIVANAWSLLQYNHRAGNEIILLPIRAVSYVWYTISLGILSILLIIAWYPPTIDNRPFIVGQLLLREGEASK